MKKSLFYYTFFLGCIFLLSCQKKSIQPAQVASFENSAINQSDLGTNHLALTNDEKSIVFPSFDLTQPINSEGEDVTMTSYLKINYVAGDEDYWTQHEFVFGERSLRLMYHFVNNDVDISTSDVYDEDGIYQFTYTDDHGIVSIDYNNTQNQQQFPQVSMIV